jgi:hypothetical protein
MMGLLDYTQSHINIMYVLIGGGESYKNSVEMVVV